MENESMTSIEITRMIEVFVFLVTCFLKRHN